MNALPYGPFRWANEHWAVASPKGNAPTFSSDTHPVEVVGGIRTLRWDGDFKLLILSRYEPREHLALSQAL